MFQGIIHKDDNGVVWFDDVPVTTPEEVPRRKAWAGTRWYHTATVRPTDLTKLFGSGDVAFGPSPGRAIGYRLACQPKGVMQIYDSRVWGVRSEDPNDTDAQLKYLQLEAKAADIPVSASVAMTALKTYMDRYDGRNGRPKLAQLAPRWRGLAHSSFHGGPIVICRGGAEHAIEIDRKSAYLDALMDESPIVTPGFGNGWVTYEEAKWDGIRTRFGFADVTARVSRERLGEHAIPPLPIHTIYGSIRPTGLLRGVWTIAALREAEERGEVEILQVHQWACVLKTMPLFKQIAEDFAVLPKQLGKRLYTRFWGKFASKGGFTGRVAEKGEDGEIYASGLWWKFDGVELESHKAPPHYRPDIAAMVSDHNQRHVTKVLRELDPKSIVAVHVDAIWTDDVEGAKRILSSTHEVGSWESRGEGRLRYYTAGCYKHGERMGASGYDAEVLGPITPEKLEQWVNNGNASRLHMKGRVWSSDPSEDEAAASVSMDVEMDPRLPAHEGPSIYEKFWTPNGWRFEGHEEKERKAREAMRHDEDADGT